MEEGGEGVGKNEKEERKKKKKRRQEGWGAPRHISPVRWLGPDPNKLPKEDRFWLHV